MWGSIYLQIYIRIYVYVCFQVLDSCILLLTNFMTNSSESIQQRPETSPVKTSEGPGSVSQSHVWIGQISSSLVYQLGF